MHFTRNSKTLSIVLVLLLAIPSVLAAFGHDAAYIRNGTFGGGDYVFPANLSVNSGLNVNRSLFVNNSVGIGMASSSSPLRIKSVSANSIVASIQAAADTDMIFDFLDNGASGDAYLRMFKDTETGTQTETIVLNSDGNSYFIGGNVGIGAASPSALLDVNGAIYMALEGSVSSNTVCYAVSGGAGGGYKLGSCSSSLRYKKNIQNFTSGLNLISKLRPVNFNWINNNESDVGFIAEDVEKIDPTFVVYMNNTVEGVKYSSFVPVLTKAIQELKAQNDALKAIVCKDHPSESICQ